MRLVNFFAALKLWPYQVFAVLVLAFILGTVISSHWFFEWQSIWPIYILVLMLLVFCSFINLVLGNKILVLVSWSLLFVILAMANYSYNKAKFCVIPEGQYEITGTVITNPSRDFSQQELVVGFKQNNCKARLLAKLPRSPEYKFGEKIILTGNLAKPGMIEDFDYEKYLRPKYVGYLLKNPSGIRSAGQEEGLKFRLLRYLYTAKNSVEKKIFASINEPEASLGAGILTGFRATLSDEMKNDLNTAGLTHLIALSGFNITIIITAITFLLAGWMSRRSVFIAGVGLAMAFIVMTGASASSIRAGIFSLLILWARTIGRRAFQTNILLLTAGTMLVINPFLLADDMGFQLSFLAFAGLVYLAEPISFLLERSKLGKLPKFIRGPLVETLSAQIAVFPLIAFAFGRVSIISPLSNIFVLWLVPATMLMAFMTALGGLILPILGSSIGLLAWPMLAYILMITKYSARVPLAALTLPKYNAWLIGGLYLFLILAYRVTMKRIKRMRTV